MTQFLPPNLLALFAPRDPIPFLPPPCKLPHEKKSRGYLGVGAFLDHFEVNICLFFRKLIPGIRMFNGDEVFWTKTIYRVYVLGFFLYIFC